MVECWRTRSCVDTYSYCKVMSSTILAWSKDSFTLALFTLWLLQYFWSLFWDDSLARGDVDGDISDQHLFSVLEAFVSFNINSYTQHKETPLLKSGIYSNSWIYQYGGNSNFLYNWQNKSKLYSWDLWTSQPWVYDCIYSTSHAFLLRRTH